MADTMLKIYIWRLSKENQLISTDLCDMIVAAATEKGARELANQRSKSEGYVWTDPSLVTATKIGLAEEGIHGIILCSAEEQE